MNIRVLVIYIAALAFLSACKSDPATSVTTTAADYGTLEIKPNPVTGTRYVNTIFSARVNGVAQSDVTYTVDYGDGGGEQSTGYMMGHPYLTPGTYTVTVKARDWFADTLIATTTFATSIKDTDHFITLTQHTLDTSVVMRDSNTKGITWILSPIFVQSSSPHPALHMDCHVTAAGFDSTYTNYGENTWRNVALPGFGTYTLVFSAFDDANNLFGRDSATLTLRKR